METSNNYYIIQEFCGDGDLDRYQFLEYKLWLVTSLKISFFLKKRLSNF